MISDTCGLHRSLWHWEQYYVGKHGECLVGAYVDDILCACSKPETFKWFSSLFLHSDTNPHGFYGKHLGKVNYLLGMAIDQYDDYSISVNQTKYITKLLDKFVPSHQINAIKHHKPCSPDSFSKLSTAKDDTERAKVSNLPYLELMGSLLYVSCMTRPDIAYYVTTLCKFMHDPSLQCYDAAVSLLLYLGHTKEHVGLHYDGCTKAPSGFGRMEPDASKITSSIESNHGFVAYSDASWRSAANKYSSYGYIVYLFGGVVSFASKYLKIVAMSSAEAEYAAASQTCREMTYIRNVCSDLGLDCAFAAGGGGGRWRAAQRDFGNFFLGCPTLSSGSDCRFLVGALLTKWREKRPFFTYNKNLSIDALYCITTAIQLVVPGFTLESHNMFASRANPRPPCRHALPLLGSVLVRINKILLIKLIETLWRDVLYSTVLGAVTAQSTVQYR